MNTNWKMALIVVAIIGIVFIALFTVAGIGTVESSTGHFLKNTFSGTAIEQSAASLETAGNDLTTSAHKALGIFTGLITLIGIVYWRSRS